MQNLSSANVKIHMDCMIICISNSVLLVLVHRKNDGCLFFLRSVASSVTSFVHGKHNLE